MTETIEVRYKPLITVDGVSVYHKYIVYTDSNGDQWYARGGPSISMAPLPVVGFGYLDTIHGAYDDTTADWDRDNNDEHEVIASDDDLSAQWQAIKDAMDAIKAGQWDYGPLTQNSNSAADIALAAAGLPPATLDDGWISPASDRTLNIPWVGNLLLPEWIKPAIGLWDRAPNANSPLVLDIDGDGIEVTKLGFTSSASKVHFDLDNDGFAERTGWITGGDGLLAWDKNSNGIIDNQSELFGNSATYSDGFAYLASLDSNSDNKITTADANWSNLRVWIDADADGQTDSGELHTLGSLNITEISLNSTALTNTFLNENEVTDTSTFTRNGQIRTISDVWFRNDGVDSISLSQTPISEEVYFLPTLKGFGRIEDLHVKMSSDTDLRDLVADFYGSWSTAKFGDTEALNDEVKEILFAWAGVDGVSPTSRGPWVDARELNFIELLLDDNYLNLSSGTDPSTIGQGQTITENFAYILESFKGQLISQVAGDIFEQPPHYSVATGEVIGGLLSEDALEDIGIEAATATDPQSYWFSFASALNSILDIRALTANEISALNDAIHVALPSSSWPQISSAAIVQIDPQYTPTAFSDNLGGSSIGESISGGDGDDFIAGYNGSDSLYGEGGNDEMFGGYDTDYLDGGDGDDLMDGGSGNDILSGGNGADILIGGSGDDWFYGGAGNDVFRFASVSGNKSIDDSSGTDTIEFLSGINPADVRLIKSNYDLMIYVGATDSIWVINQFRDLDNNTNSYGEVETISFADNTVINLLGPLTFTGTSAGDALYGTKNADTFIGKGGYDSIYGYEGNDTYVFGNEGGQTWIYDTSGNDKIVLSSAFAAEDVRFEAWSNTLIIHLGTTHDIFLQNHFYDIQNGTNTYNEVESLIFSDGSSVDLLGSLLFKGTAGGEAVYGTNGADTLNGLAGYDSLYGYLGDDTYVFNAGFEQDVVYDTGGTDKIVLDSVFTTENISLSSSGATQTYISFAGYSDVIYIDAQRAVSPNNKIEFLQFSDGFKADLLNYQTWVWGASSAETTAGTSSADTIFGRGGNDTISGANGNDALHGGSGTDTINGGNGNDQINGGIGNDTLYGDANDDTLYGDDGLDTMTGGTGADKFVFQSGSAFNNIDVITDFSTAQGDKIDISDLLDGYDPLTSAITDFVQITTSGSNSILKIDHDGGANGFVQVATLTGVTGLTDEHALLTSGNLIAA